MQAARSSGCLTSATRIAGIGLQKLFQICHSKGDKLLVRFAGGSQQADIIAGLSADVSGHFLIAGVQNPFDNIFHVMHRKKRRAALAAGAVNAANWLMVGY